MSRSLSSSCKEQDVICKSLLNVQGLAWLSPLDTVALSVGFLALHCRVHQWLFENFIGRPLESYDVLAKGIPSEVSPKRVSLAGSIDRVSSTDTFER